jgi:membrane-associated phospholipid phosphatase
MLKRVLEAVSLVFEPFFVGLLTFLVVVKATPLGVREQALWFLVSILLSGLPPLLVLVYEKRTGKISDWFMYKREERQDVELAWTAGSALLALTTFFFSAPKLLFALALALFLISLVYSLINLVWKISIHTSLITLFVLCLVLFVSPIFLFSTILIFLVGFSRWYLHKHTLSQITFGSLLTLVISYLVFFFLKVSL